MSFSAWPQSFGPLPSAVPWRARLCRILPAIGLAAGMDQVAKAWAIRHLDPSLPLIFLDGVLRLQLVHNPGIHLGLGADWPPWLRFWLFCVAAASIAGVLLFVAVISRNRSALQWIGFSLLIGGLAGNVVDRFLHEGSAVDFMNVSLHAFSTGVFNLADIEIVGGLTLLALAYLKYRPQSRILF